MKILINTITREDIINAAELVAKAIPIKGNPIIEVSLSCPEIAGEAFPVGEWRHFDEKWVAENTAILAKYPNIKEAHVVLEERLKRQIEEQGLQSFAQGIKDAATLYKQELPAIADTVLKIASVKVEEV